MPSPTRRDAVANRESLLDAARVELNLDLSASLETIAASAGLSRRAVYGHFANRDELIRELVTRGAARVAAAMDVPRHPDPVIELALIASRLWHEVENVRVMSLFAVRGPYVALMVDELRPLRRRIVGLITEGQAAGTIRTDIATARLARLVEEGALSVLGESTAQDLSAAEGHGLVMRVVLSLLGLDWRAADALVTDDLRLHSSPAAHA